MPETTAEPTVAGRAELCRSCRQPIDEDGFCVGCGARLVRPESEAEALDRRVSQGQFGFVVFGLLALTLWSWAGGPIDPSAEPGALFSVDFRPGPSLWLIGGLLAGVVLLVGAVLTSVATSDATRLLVWTALVLAWLTSAVGIFLVARQAQTLQVATASKARESQAALDTAEARFAVQLHNYQERCRRRDQALADALLSGVLRPFGEPDITFEADAAEHARVVRQLRNELVVADALRGRAWMLLLASVCIVAAKMSLLFLAAAALSWSGVGSAESGSSAEPTPVRS